MTLFDPKVDVCQKIIHSRKTTLYLNINAKGNIAGITKRDLKTKLLQNKKEREAYDLEMEQEEKRYRVPTGFETKDETVRISQTAAINDILNNHQNPGANSLKLPQNSKNQHKRRISESSNTNSPKVTEKLANSHNTIKQLRNTQKLAPPQGSPVIQKQPSQQQNSKKPINRVDEDGNDIEAMFYLIPVGLRVVAIQHVATENYRRVLRQ